MPTKVPRARWIFPTFHSKIRGSGRATDTILTEKVAPYEWRDDQQVAFENLKCALCVQPFVAICTVLTPKYTPLRVRNRFREYCSRTEINTIKNGLRGK